ncbi:MAG: hypothetical protein NTW80_12685, partial [Deltaproteobacteria bacterium]|nr:hypothetical protein [Deltaproteobacteria bacterium]
MLKIVKKMKKILILGLGSAMLLVAASAAMASTVTLTNDYGNLSQYAGAFVGPIPTTLDINTPTSTPIPGGMTCVDISQNSYFGATWTVNVSTLDPTNINSARHGSDAAALFNYEEAAWLLGQIPSLSSNPTQAQIAARSAQVGAIQFAIWDIFNPGGVDTHFGATRDKTAEISLLAQAATAASNPGSYDFTSVRIYTPINITDSPNDANASNQEFMSGTVISASHTSGNQAPIPASFVLLASGLLGLGLLSRRKKAAV